MGLLDFFKRNKKLKSEAIKTEKPSPEQILFADTVLEFIGPTVESHDFLRQVTEVKTYSANIVYRKGKQYIKISSTNYPTDYPYYYNIILGEGDSENFFEYDWNSIALWALARVIAPETTISSYDFPFNEQVKPSIQQANVDLIKFGDTFLKGEMAFFYRARQTINQQREPYKIHSPDKNGNYTTTDEPKSVDQKRKYS